MKLTRVCFLIALATVITWPFLSISSIDAQDSTNSDTIEIVHDSNCAHNNPDSIKAAIAAQEERASNPPTVLDFFNTGKYYAFALAMLGGLILLLLRKVNFIIRLASLLILFALFGLDYFFPLHPSPMCGMTKLFMFRLTQGQFFAAFLAMFFAMMIPSLIGRKLFCGWVCPLGVLQELTNKIPFKFKRKKFNFAAFNSVRMSLLVMFVLTMFAVRNQIIDLATKFSLDGTTGVWAASSAFSIYDPLNFFELLHWSIDTTFLIMMPILLLVSLVYYRPFCYSICPIGAVTWLLEQIAPGRIRVDHSKCNSCGICVDKSPCPTIAVLIDSSRKIAPDCTSCGECLATCPTDAIRFSFKA